MSAPTGYEGVTARIAGRLMTGTPPLRQWMAEQIVQAEFAPLVELLGKVDVELAEWALPGELPDTLECGDCDAQIKDAANWFDHTPPAGRPECDAATFAKAVRAALDRVRTP